MAMSGAKEGRPPAVRPSAVIAGDHRPVAALVALFDSWAWPVLATAPDDLAGLFLVRRLQPDLFVVHGSGAGRFGDLELARERLPGTSFVTLVDVPQQLAARQRAVLTGLPAGALRERLEAALAEDRIRVAAVP